MGKWIWKRLVLSLALETAPGTLQRRATRSPESGLRFLKLLVSGFAIGARDCGEASACLSIDPANQVTLAARSQSVWFSCARCCCGEKDTPRARRQSQRDKAHDTSGCQRTNRETAAAEPATVHKAILRGASWQSDLAFARLTVEIDVASLDTDADMIWRS